MWWHELTKAKNRPSFKIRVCFSYFWLSAKPSSTITPATNEKKIWIHVINLHLDLCDKNINIIEHTHIRRHIYPWMKGNQILMESKVLHEMVSAVNSYLDSNLISINLHFDAGHERCQCIKMPCRESFICCWCCSMRLLLPPKNWIQLFVLGSVFINGWIYA